MKLTSHIAYTVDAGFTLLELLVTVSIFGILSVIAVPSYTNIVANHRTKAAALDLFTDMILSRSEALKRNASVAIQPSGSHWELGWSVLDPNIAGARIAAHGAVGAVTIRAQDNSSNPATVTYQSSGRIKIAAASSNPYFVIASTAVSAISYCVSADLSGRPYMAKGSTC